MSKILCFVFAIAIFGAAVNAEFVASTAGAPSHTIPSNSRGIPNAPVLQTASAAPVSTSGKNPYESLVKKLAAKVGTLTDAQTDAANAIIAEVHQQLTSRNEPENVNLAAYFLATAYSDASLVPTEEKLKSDAKGTKQASYFRQGHQGRGYVHFTGAYNYDRFAKDLKLAIDSNPALLLDKTVAAKVLVFGALNGRFTGLKIGQFVPSAGKVDFVAARRAINGDVNAVSIAKLAADIAN